jgi:hypothetical protein
LPCHSDFNNSSQTLHNFSLHSKQIKTVTNSEKLKNMMNKLIIFKP